MNQLMRYPTKPESIITTDDEPAQCSDCGSDMQLVRPGKWQCDTCESKDFIRKKQAEAVRWAAERAAASHELELSNSWWLLEQADAIERGEVEI